MRAIISLGVISCLSTPITPGQNAACTFDGRITSKDQPKPVSLASWMIWSALRWPGEML